MTPDERLVWEAWRTPYHPTAAPTPGGSLKHIRAGVARLGGDRTARLVQWAHEAPHDAAAWLRGPDYDLGKSGRYLALSNLMVADKLDQRDGWASEWEASGSPHYTKAAGGGLVNGAAVAWSRLAGWLKEVSVGVRTTLPDATPDDARIVSAFVAAGGRRRYERDHNLAPMQADFARHLGHP